MYYGKTIANRVLLKIHANFIYYYSCKKKAVYYISGEKIAVFLEKHLELKRKMHFIFKMCDSVNQIQNKWRYMLNLNYQRKAEIKAKWNLIIEELKVFYSEKGKKYENSLRRLNEVSDDTINKAINNYYSTQKRKYYKLLTHYFFKKKNEKVYLENKQIITKNSVLENTKRIENYNIPKLYPSFMYMPSDDYLKKLILQTIDI